MLIRHDMQLRFTGHRILNVAPWSTRSKPAPSGRLQVFAATDDRIGLYTRYMRGQIRSYLTNHLRLVPDAVVLVATLRAPSASPGAPAAPSDPASPSGGAASGAAADAGCSDSNGSSRNSEGNSINSGGSVGSSMRGGGGGIRGSDGVAMQKSAAGLQQQGEAEPTGGTFLVTSSPLPSGRGMRLSVCACTPSEVQWHKCEPRTRTKHRDNCHGRPPWPSLSSCDVNHRNRSGAA